ncbi:hypothetical protein DFR44_11037 [Hydromonas duriensis]|uniref:Lipoprotein n=2 Tax=Hydromonas duriensis TaxID=1527608 RepID=A0A4R6Y7R1_9BURK|nr:hypothetical protein DFR44_11037 [Hydromonas duriensis]
MWAQCRYILLVVTALVLGGCQAVNVLSKASHKISRPVNIDGYCSQTDEAGYRDQIKISVKNNTVQALDWTASPKQGTCRFQLNDFTQIATRPTADLQSKTDRRCHVLVWQDRDHITVAANGCQSSCPASDQLLPVLLDSQTGGCKPR